MAGREKAVKVGGEGMQLLQGALDTIVLRTLAAMGPATCIPDCDTAGASVRGAAEPEPGDAVSGAGATAAVWVDRR